MLQGKVGCGVLVGINTVDCTEICEGSAWIAQIDECFRKLNKSFSCADARK
jgi:hypothetical protein